MVLLALLMAVYGEGASLEPASVVGRGRSGIALRSQYGAMENPALFAGERPWLLRLSAKDALPWADRQEGVVEKPPQVRGDLAFVAPLSTNGAMGIAVSHGRFGSLDAPNYQEWHFSGGWGIPLGPIHSVGVQLEGSMEGAGGSMEGGRVDGSLAVHGQWSRAFSGALIWKRLLGSFEDLSQSGAWQAGLEGSAVLLGLGLDLGVVDMSLDAHWWIRRPEVDLRVGSALHLGDRAVVSAGIALLGPDRGVVPSFGAGLSFGPLRLDYALSFPLNLPMLGEHHLSVSLESGRGKKR